MRTKKGEILTQIALEVFKIQGLLVSEGDRIAGEFKLSSARWKVLGAVAMAEEPLTVAQVAREMGQARQSVQRIASDMAEGGYFTWKDNPAHKRAKLLYLTEKGKRTFQQLESAQAPWANEAAKQLDEQELKIALGVLRKLVGRFET
ncbi:MAG: MarR family transcriptional regulator [Cyanobacteria bacterium J06555_13]